MYDIAGVKIPQSLYCSIQVNNCSMEMPFFISESIADLCKPHDDIWFSLSIVHNQKEAQCTDAQNEHHRYSRFQRFRTLACLAKVMSDFHCIFCVRNNISDKTLVLLRLVLLDVIVHNAQTKEKSQ